MPWAPFPASVHKPRWNQEGPPGVGTGPGTLPGAAASVAVCSLGQAGQGGRNGGRHAAGGRSTGTPAEGNRSMNKRGRNRRAARRGFTLIEIMIVIGIVVALATIVGIAALSRGKDAKMDLCRVDMNTIRSAMELFQYDFDRWPTDEEGLQVLWDKSVLSADSDEKKWKGYLRQPMPNDRWGRPWGYRQVSEFGDEGQFDLWSFGPDGQEGTEDDITSWTVESDDSFAPMPGGRGR